MRRMTTRALWVVLLSVLVPAPAPAGLDPSISDSGARACSAARLLAAEAREKALLGGAEALGKAGVSGASGALGPAEALGWTSPTPDQKRIDVTYYGLNLALDPTEERIRGEEVIRALVTNGPLTTADLDLDPAMAVTRVSTPTTATLPFLHRDGLLVITLPDTLATGDRLELSIAWQGKPENGLHFDQSKGEPMIWTLSAPDLARAWWPCKDHPEDKADSVDLTVSVPHGILVAGNGTLVEQSDDGVTARFHWRERHPISTYLVSLSAHPYSLYSDTYRSAAGDTMPIVFYNFPSNVEQVRAVQAKVKNMLTAFASRFGEYPFLDEKYGHADFLFSGGMENQTLTGLGVFTESVVAHELSHQWWGDLVTCRDFSDVWLNEGFATYCEALWAEAVGGTSAYRAKMALTRYTGAGTVRVPPLAESGRIYSTELSYNKGSWILHMLRHVVGDDAFFRGLREYRARHENGTATTEDLRDVFEEVSGNQIDLGPFFSQWVDGEGVPIYRYDWSAAPAGGGSEGGYDVTLRLRQVQAYPVFVMPVDVELTTAAGTVRSVVQNNQREQSFTIHVESAPSEVTIDPNQWILRQIMPPLENPVFDRSMLLVNGLSFRGATAGEVRSAFEARAFQGKRGFDFWDIFDEPEGGYPYTLPAPLGHGALPDSVLRRYRTVLWLANNSSGDADAWQQAPLHSYLEAGGNVLLLARSAGTLLSEPYREYLGIGWAGVDTVYDWVPAVAGLPPLRPTGQQTTTSWFDPEVGPESVLLYKSVSGHSPAWGVGVVRVPGGTPSNGGVFAVLSGRPYRWNSEDLRASIDAILSAYMPDQSPAGTSAWIRLSPNPMRTGGTIRFALPTSGTARIGIYDLAGRRLRVLRDAVSPAGENGEVWDGRDDSGRQVPTGMYFARLSSPGGDASGRVIILR